MAAEGETRSLENKGHSQCRLWGVVVGTGL